MAKNEVEVFFGKLQERHQTEARRLGLLEAEALGRGDLDESDRIDEQTGVEKGRLRFLRDLAVEVLNRLKEKGIKILEVEEAPAIEAPPTEVLSAPAAVPKVVSPSVIQTFKAPDGQEIPGQMGRLLAFLADDEGGWIPKRRDDTAKSVYGVTGIETEQKISSLVRYSQQPNAELPRHGIEIKSHIVPPEVRARGGKGFDWISFVPQEVQAPPAPAEVGIPAPEAEEEEIPEILTTPDGFVCDGQIGKLLAFLAHRGTFIDRLEVARHVFGRDDKKSADKVTKLIGYAKNPASAAFKHGVRIQTEKPSVRDKRKGARAKDTVVFATAPVTETVVTIEQPPKAEIPRQLQAATLAEMLLEKFHRQPEKLHELGIELGLGDIRELEKIRQQSAEIEPEVRNRARTANKRLVARYLDDTDAVYKELENDPDGQDCLLALAPFTPLAELDEEAIDLLFEE